jgi:DNA excision repair protein ERCC-5
MSAAAMSACRDSFGWDKVKADDVLKPVLTSYAERTTQLRIDQFLTSKQRFAKIRSKRLQEAVTAIVASTGSDVNPELFYASTEHMPDLPKAGGGVLAKDSEAAAEEAAE